MVRLIEPHVGPGAEETAAVYARTIARAIERNAFMVQRDKTAAIVREVQAIRSDIRGLGGKRSPDGLIAGDPLPIDALAPVEELSELSPDEGNSLRASLANEATRLGEVRGLISDPPPWVNDGSAALWATLGEVAQAFGLLDLAEQATHEAAGRPGADRARLFARASDLARLQGESDKADELLDEARAINPNHPSVRIVGAQLTTDAKAQLAALEGIEPLHARQGAAFEVTRALCHLALDEPDEADAAASRARDLNPDALAVRELRPLLTLIKNQRREQESVDWNAVREAGDEFLALHDEVAEVGRHAEAAGMRARAAEAYAIGGDRGRAVELLESVTDSELQALDQEGARRYVLVGLEAHRPDISEQYIATIGDDDGARLLRAQVEVYQRPDPSLAVISELDSLLESDDTAVREQAAFVRVSTAFFSDDVTWSDAAEEIVRGVDEVMADAFVASRLAEEGDVSSARARLVRHSDDPRALRALVDLAAQIEDWTTAVELQTSLVDQHPTPERRLRQAELLARSDRSREAEPVLDALGRDTDAPIDLRASATARLAELLWSSRRYSELADVTSRWLSLKPRSPAAAWGRVLALTMLSRYDEALEVVDTLSLEPRDEQDALLAAHVFRRALEPVDSLPRIIELSDEFNRQVEGLEAMVIYVGLGPGGHDLPEDLEARRAATFQEFSNRFPDSSFITAIPAPESAEEVETFLREHFSPGASQLAELQQQMVHGQTAVAVLAAFVRKHVPQVWARLGALPLAFGDPALRELERQAARDAIGKSAVWESSALFIAGGLGDEIEGIIRRALPGSVVPQSVLDDASAGADQPFGDEEGLELGWDARADRPQIAEISEQQRRTDRLSAEGVLRIARELRPVPDLESGSPGDFDELLGEKVQTSVDLAFRTWVSAFSVAKRLGLPLYSDDRFVRAHAQGLGISSFGTWALLEVLAERSLLDEETRDEALRRLRITGAMGIPVEPEQLVAEAEEAEWDISPLLAQALLDPTSWRDGSGMTRHITFLRHSFHAAPEKFPQWVSRVYQAGRSAALPELRVRVAPLLLVLAWLSGDTDFALELLRILRQLELLPDPLVHAFGILGALTEDAPSALRLQAIRAAFASVGHADHMRLLALLRFESACR